MGLDFRVGFHACYATFAMHIYMLPHVRPIEVFFQDFQSLVGPKCPINPPLCASLMSEALKEPWGMQGLLPLKRY